MPRKKNNKKIIIVPVIVIAAILTFIFSLSLSLQDQQIAGEFSTGALNKKPGTCGNGFPETGEQCEKSQFCGDDKNGNPLTCVQCRCIPQPKEYCKCAAPEGANVVDECPLKTKSACSSGADAFCYVYTENGKIPYPCIWK